MKMPLLMLVFLGVFIFLYGGIHIYVYLRLVRDIHLSGLVLRLLQASFILLCLSFPLVHFVFRYQSARILYALNFVSSLWMGAVLYFLLLALAFDAYRGFAYLLHFIFPFDPNELIPSSRHRALFIVLLGAGLCIYGLIEASRLHVTELKIPIFGLPEKLNGFRLVQITDVHIGGIVRKRRVEKIVQSVNEQNPDAIVITGDLLDGEAMQLEEELAVLKKLKSTYGTFAVTGNHEFFAGIEKVSLFMEKAGIRLLRNSWIKVADAIQIAGRDDPVARRILGAKTPSVAEILQGIDSTQPVILLYHSPVTTLDDLEKAGIQLQLSGHTHKGQLWPFQHIIRRVYKTPYGFFSNGKASIYISNGAGTWGPPMRVGAWPEIVLLRLGSK